MPSCTHWSAAYIHPAHPSVEASDTRMQLPQRAGTDRDPSPSARIWMGTQRRERKPSPPLRGVHDSRMRRERASRAPRRVAQKEIEKKRGGGDHTASPQTPSSLLRVPGDSAGARSWEDTAFPIQRPSTSRARVSTVRSLAHDTDHRLFSVGANVSERFRVHIRRGGRAGVNGEFLAEEKVEVGGGGGEGRGGGRLGWVEGKEDDPVSPRIVSTSTDMLPAGHWGLRVLRMTRIRER
ncbi:hypothetical protein B0H13DRAFT_1876454 [Mycena leptocephala]|nr:hypothetical protein B0H13DRAFT_1876454 [Mycena leptocephala]